MYVDPRLLPVRGPFAPDGSSDAPTPTAVPAAAAAGTIPLPPSPPAPPAWTTHLPSWPPAGKGKTGSAAAPKVTVVAALSLAPSSGKSGEGKAGGKAHSGGLAQIVAIATSGPDVTTSAGDMMDGAEGEFWRVEMDGAGKAGRRKGKGRKRQQGEQRQAQGQQREQARGEEVRQQGEGSGGTKAPALARLRRRMLSVQQLWIWPFTHYKPTNQVMLCYRTIFQDLRAPGANEDFLAAKFRDELMPLRGWVHRKLPALLHINKAFIQGPAFGCPGIMNYLDARTRWLDREVATAIREGFTQVVVVAAGYDTRAYRLEAPGLSYFEIDLPEASERKRQLVERVLPADQFPRPTYIGADLSQVSVADALLGSRSVTTTGAGARGAAATAGRAYIVKRKPTGASAGTDGASTGLFKPGSSSANAHATDIAAHATSAAAAVAGPAAGGCGFDPRARTLFTVEGLLYYLPPLAVARLLVSIRAVAGPGSRVAFDFLHQDVFSGRRWEPGYETLRLTVRNKGEPKRSGLDPAGLKDYLAPMGWRLTYMPTPRQVAEEMYPDMPWSRINPPLPSFYNFAVAEAE